MAVPKGNLVCMALCLLCLYCSTSEAAIFELGRAATTLLNIESISDWALSVKIGTCVPAATNG